MANEEGEVGDLAFEAGPVRRPEALASRLLRLPSGGNQEIRSFSRERVDSTRGMDLSDPNRKLVGGNGRGIPLIGRGFQLHVMYIMSCWSLVNSMFWFCVGTSIETKEYGIEKRR